MGSFFWNKIHLMYCNYMRCRLNQHSIFYIGTGKKKMLAMLDCERILAFLIKRD